MPGIAGVVGESGFDPAAAERMIASMRHEQSYVTGSYADQSMGVSVGWVVHPNSFSDCMPLLNARRDICLIFSGENFIERDEDAQSSGARGRFDMPTARNLLLLYETMGTAFLRRLNGWFSGALIDLRNRSVVLFNDRYGLGRIYIHETPGRFCFASEAKALLEIAPSLRSLDLQGAAESFACGAALQNRTLFAGVSLLPAGAQWTISSNGEVKKENYFSTKMWEDQPPLSPDEFDESLKETFARILPKYFVSNSSLAMSLTGGLDGRMIMAWANRPPGSLPCYTFGGPYRDCADVALARRIAAICQQAHQTIHVGDDFLRNFPRLAEKSVFVSDGAMDVTGAVELYVNRIAAQTAPVRLTGNYGSEIIRANVAFRLGHLSEAMLSPDFSRAVHEARETFRAECKVSGLSFVVSKQTPWHHYARLAVEQSQLTLRSPYLDNELVALMFRAPAPRLSSKAPSMQLIAEGDLRLAKLPTDRGEIYGDSSLRGRFRERVADFMIKAEYAYDYGMPQRLASLDHKLARLHLERLFLGRHKFYHFRVWYRDQLSRYLKDVLLDPRALQRPYIDGKAMERMVLAHTQGVENWTLEIHRLLTLELLQRQLIDR